MDEINNLDIWRLIPPEEKLEMMAKSHARGILAAGISLIIASTCAVGLQIPTIFWATILCSPFIFQFASNKAFRNFKPSTVLRYLAARSAARRYAFSTRATDLDCHLMFRGQLERVFSEDNAMEAMAAVIDATQKIDVWVSLFKDAIVMMSECPGGAKLELGHLINDKLTVEGSSESGDEYASDRELLISFPKETALDVLLEVETETQTYKLTSKYPAALVVFEKRIEEYRELVKQTKEAMALALSQTEDLDDNKLFSRAQDKFQKLVDI